jgi:hypothetical protein
MNTNLGFCLALHRAHACLQRKIAFAPKPSIQSPLQRLRQFLQHW